MNNWKEKIPAIFAEQGDILEVPLDAQTDRQVSFKTGYTANYERDAVDDLGNPLVQYGIERTKFNYLMKVITSALKEIQETVPTYEDNGVDKVDVSSIVTETNAFDVLESILCINADTGKASKITKDDIIKNLNPDVDLSNSNISVSQLATTAVDNFLALDGDIVKKADKLLQEAIAEINLSADNVVVSASATVDVVDSVIVMNTDGKVAKATTIPQEKIEEINLSKDNIAIDEYTDQEQGSVFKPVISSNTGSVYRKDKLEGSMIESIKFEQIEDDVYAKSINYTIMTSDTYPDGIDNLIQTGVYHVITPDEYKDIINDQIDTADKEEYILKVMNSFLTNLNMIKEPFIDIASLVAYAGSDFISPYEPIIQVLGVSANETDDTNVTQVFKLNGEVKGQRTFTATTSGLENEVWIPVSTYIRDTIEEEFIAFMYDGVPDEATNDLNILRTFKTIGYNNKEELSYGFSFGGFNCYDVITIDTDLDWTDESDTVDNDVYVAAYTYNQSLLTIDDTKIIKLNGKVIEDVNDITNVKDVIFFVKDRTHNIKYIALGRETGGAIFLGYLFDANNDEFLDTTKTKNFFRPNYHLIFDAMSCTDYYNFSNSDIKLRNIVIGADIKMFPHSVGVNTDTVIAKNLIVKDSSFNPVMTVDDNAVVINNTTTTINSDNTIIDSTTTTVNGDLTVNGEITNLQGKLDAKLDKTGGDLSGDLVVNGSVEAGNLIISGSTTLKGNLLIEGSETTIEGTKTTINSDTVEINNPVVIDSDLTITGNFQADKFTLPDIVNLPYLEIQQTPKNLRTYTNQSITNAGTDNVTNAFSFFSRDPERLDDYIQIGGRTVGNKNKQSSTVAFITATHTSRTTGEAKSSWYHTDVQNLSDNSILRRQVLNADVHICQGSLQTSQFLGTLNQQNVRTLTDKQAAPVLSNLFMAEQPIIPTSRADIQAGMSFRFIENVKTDPYLKNLYISWKTLKFNYNATTPANSTVFEEYSNPIKFSSLQEVNQNQSAGRVMTNSGILITFKGIDAKGIVAELLLINIIDTPIVYGVSIFARLDNNVYASTTDSNKTINIDNDVTTSDIFMQV